MAVANKIGIKGNEAVEGFHPCLRIAVKFFENCRTDILCKEYPCSVCIEIERNRTGCMSRCVETDKFMVAEMKEFLFL